MRLVSFEKRPGLRASCGDGARRSCVRSSIESLGGQKVRHPTVVRVAPQRADTAAAFRPAAGADLCAQRSHRGLVQNPFEVIVPLSPRRAGDEEAGTDALLET